MSARSYKKFVAWLTDEFGESLRWIASYNDETYDYKVRYIREDLETDLSDLDLQTIIHRSLAVYNRDHAEDVYFHLGNAECLVVQHERALAVHVYLSEETGVVVKLERDAEVTLPTFPEECLARLGPDSGA